MTTITHTDYLFQQGTGGALNLVPGVWVRLLNNSTAVNYYSTAVTDATSAFTHSAVPGDYSLYTGSAATVVGTPTLRNAHYSVPVTAGDDAVLGSGTVLASGPYTGTAVVGGADYGAAVRITGGKPWYDPTHPTFGAKFDGANDDAVGIRACLLALRNSTAASGKMLMPPGTGLLSTAVSETGAAGTTTYLFKVWSNTIVCGAGEEATILKVGAVPTGQAEGMRAIVSQSEIDGTGTPGLNITFQDFSIDGNAINQTLQGMYGIAMTWTENVKHVRVRIRDVKGSATSEGAAFYTLQSTSTEYTDCEALRTIGSAALCGSGFAASWTTHISYKGCHVYNLDNWQGFTVYTCRHGEFVNCIAYLNVGGIAGGGKGFNTEISFDMHYTNCTSGGQTASGRTSGRYAADTALGNKVGFYCNQSARVIYEGCNASRNTGNGWTFVNTPAGAGNQIIGGSAVANAYGYGFEAAIDAQNCRISGGAIAVSNTSGQGYDPALFVLTGQMTAPAVPATTVALTNPHPLAVTIYITGGTMTDITIDAVALGWGASPAVITLAPKSTIALTYTVVPVWRWWANV